jgi:hypothetical protein
MNPTNPRCLLSMESTSGCTATGVQLANRLLRLVPDLLAGDVPACIGHRLADAVDQVERKQVRHAALLGATTMLDPDGNLSANQCAARLAVALARFDGIARRRVESGHRPASALEQYLLILLQSGGPTCQEKLRVELLSILPAPPHGR